MFDAAMFDSFDAIYGLVVALAIGLLIGIERERHKGEGDARGAAGVRTFILIAMGGAVAERLGGVGLAVGGAFVALAALAAYRRTRRTDPGLTTEVAMMVAFLLGALAMREIALAAGLGVAVAVVLASKTRLHRFTVHTLTEQEMHDGLLLIAAAAIVLPLLPDRSLDPWGVVNPHTLWMLVVIVMGIQSAGYVALRALGPSTGLALAGFAGGFVSSTATIAAFGDRVRAAPSLLHGCVSAALFSNVSTVLQLAAVIGALSPTLLRSLALPLSAAAFAAVAVAALARRRAVYDSVGAEHVAPGRPFEPRHALSYVAIVAAILLLAAIVHERLGDAGLAAAAGVSGFADVHAAAASVAQLVAASRVSADAAAWPVLIAMIANSLSKFGMAWLRGGRGYALRVLPGLLAIVAAFAAAQWWR
jgi:uncharacterized membrane protein (DUF4010 family)